MKMFPWLQVYNPQQNYADRYVFYSRGNLGLRCGNGMCFKVQTTMLISGQRSKAARWGHHHKMICLSKHDPQSGGWIVHMNQCSCESYLASKAESIPMWGADAGEGGIIIWSSPPAWQEESFSVFPGPTPLPLIHALWFCDHFAKRLPIKDHSLGHVHHSLKIPEERYVIRE